MAVMQMVKTLTVTMQMFIIAGNAAIVPTIIFHGILVATVMQRSTRITSYF